MERIPKEICKPESEEAYLKIINKSSFPESPDDFPPTLQLPRQISKIFRNLLVDTSITGNEINTIITPDSNGFKSENAEGSPNRSGSPYKDLSRMFFGQKPLIDYHTHPNGGNTFSSIRDMSIYSATARGAYMYGIGTDAGYWLFFQSKKAMKIPISYYGKRFLASFTIQESIAGSSKRSRENGDSVKKEYANMIQNAIESLQSFGLAVYFCPSSLDKNVDILNFTRFQPEDSHRKLNFKTLWQMFNIS